MSTKWIFNVFNNTVDVSTLLFWHPIMHCLIIYNVITCLWNAIGWYDVQEYLFEHQLGLNTLCKKNNNNVWQSSRPASFSPAGLTFWPSWLERWFATLSGLSVQVRKPVGLPGHYIGDLSAGLCKAQRIDSSLRADWLSCFSLAWWEWRVARQGCLVPLRREECDNPAGLLASRQRVCPFGQVG